MALNVATPNSSCEFELRYAQICRPQYKKFLDTKKKNMKRK